MATSASEALESPETNTTFLLESILVDTEGGRYVGLILLVPLVDLLTGWRTDGSDGGSVGGSVGGVKGVVKDDGSGGGSGVKFQRVGASGGTQGCGCATTCT